MNNVLNTLKRFFKNKNTVTVIGVILIIGILYFAYNSQIKKATSPTRVPVAKETIQPYKEITRDLIEYIDVSPVMIKGNVIRNINMIVGKYSNYNTLIPQGSMFYTGTVVDKTLLPDTAFVAVKKGEVPYNFPVNINTTYGNSIFPGNKIDIYMKAVDDTGQLMVGKLIENVEVLAVKDSSGKNVFENTEESRTPSTIIFGIKEEIHILLRKASYMNEFSVVLFPVPHGGTVATEGETVVSTQYLKEFINAHTVVIDEEEIADSNQEETTPEVGE